MMLLLLLVLAAQAAHATDRISYYDFQAIAHGVAPFHLSTDIQKRAWEAENTKATEGLLGASICWGGWVDRVYQVEHDDDDYNGETLDKGNYVCYVDMDPPDGCGSEEMRLPVPEELAFTLQRNQQIWVQGAIKGLGYNREMIYINEPMLSLSDPCK